MFSPENWKVMFEALKQPKSILSQLSFQNHDMPIVIEDRLNTLDEQSFFNIAQQVMPNLDIFLDSCFGSLKNEIRNQIKMSCLSENINSPLMWAHYADNHTGFAIGYDFREMKFHSVPTAGTVHVTALRMLLSIQ